MPKKGILEIIPINPRYEPTKLTMIHLGRLREETLKNRRVDKNMLISFDKGGDDQVIKILQGAFQIFQYDLPEIKYITPKYPEIISDIKSLKRYLNAFYEGWDVYFNTTPLERHFHAILLRDGLTSSEYNFLPYEIFNPVSQNFNLVIIPNTNDLDIIDWEIMTKFSDTNNDPMSLKDFLQIEELLQQDKTIKTYDQKLRNRLNNLVEKGLMSVKLGPRGEKSYYLKYFQIEK